MRTETPPVLDLVLLGGGHSHVQVLRAFGMRPVPGVRLTIVSREVFTPYSGMLPGHVAGFYEWRDIHVDLGPLARFAGARLIPAEATGIDLEARRLSLEGHPPISFDLLSINSGAVPRPVGAGVPVKPIGRFLPRWRETLSQVREGDRVCLIGGGAGGAELALAMRRALPAGVTLALLSDTLLPGFPARAVRRIEAALARGGVELTTGFRVERAETEGGATRLVGADGRGHEAEHVYWVTGVEAPGWAADSGLATDERGFIEVDRTLRSRSHPEVFAAGDVAALVGQRRPKSGVYAVRQGPVLAANLRRAATGRPLLRYRAQRRALAILGTADRRAVAVRGRLSVSGAWVWRWKDWIDRRFMARFTALPDMTTPDSPVAEPLRERLPDAMRCGGCGAKLGADPLRRVLARLPDQRPLETRRGVTLGIGDDAAVVEVAGGSLVMTVDGFRSLVDDAYRFGRITAHHSLNDVIAMGATGLAALAMATVPLMSEAMMEEELFLLLSGAVEVLNEHGVPLVGGHSAEGGELGLALTVTGLGAGTLRKGGARAGDALLLSKALGTGVVLAADMRGRADSSRVAAALASMDQSNAAALNTFQRAGVRALTDVSGFGLAGHLGEMLRAAGVGAEVDADGVAALPGALALLGAGTASSLQPNNEGALADFEIRGAAPADPRVRLLADPQTSGGLLAAVPPEAAERCLAELRELGYACACRVGTITDGPWRIVAS